ncbi:MAG: (Fe-S)-binding protein [Phycisphaerae bacterium]
MPDSATPFKLDPRTYARGTACVHCGLCLPVCPTYTQTGHEADSPRGRIQLMLAMSDGTIDSTDATARKHLAGCLDCRACETACPSGVAYHELIEETAGKLQLARQPTLTNKLLRTLFFQVFTRPGRLKLAVMPVRLLEKLRLRGPLERSGLLKLLPVPLAKLAVMLPAGGPLWPGRLPERSRAGGVDMVHAMLANDGLSTARARVGFFPACVGSVVYERVNRMAVELLAAAGAEVLVPPTQGCCGAIHHHNGAEEAAREMARRNIDAFCPQGRPPVDYIVSTIAGCGAMLKDYAHLLRDDPAYAARAADFQTRVRDVSQVLLALNLGPMRHLVDATATYHDACHLAHGQGVRSEPRELLAGVKGLTLVPLPDSEMCCGAAGTYNLTHPDMAGKLAGRKLESIAETGAHVVITGNVGCQMHIAAEAARLGRPVKVVHPVEVLHAAVFGPTGF